MFFKRVRKRCEKRLLALLCLSDCPSVCPRGTTRLPPDGYSRNVVFAYFFKLCRKKIKDELKSDNNNAYSV